MSSLGMKLLITATQAWLPTNAAMAAAVLTKTSVNNFFTAQRSRSRSEPRFLSWSLSQFKLWYGAGADRYFGSATAPFLARERRNDLKMFIFLSTVETIEPKHVRHRLMYQYLVYWSFLNLKFRFVNCFVSKSEEQIFTSCFIRSRSRLFSGWSRSQYYLTGAEKKNLEPGKNGSAPQQCCLQTAPPPPCNLQKLKWSWIFSVTKVCHS